MTIAPQADLPAVIEPATGLRGDAHTARLRMYAMTWRDLLGTRLALQQRDMPEEIVSEFERLERRVLERLKRELRRHPMWPWLSQFPGLGGGHTALLLAAIGDPLRFPGQKCTVGHYHAPGLEVGSPCPNRAPESAGESDAMYGGADSLAAVGLTEVGTGGGGEEAGAAERHRESDKPVGCPGVMLPPRPGTGVRSLWHYLGLHVDAEGRAPRKRKGQRTTWDPALKASLLGPMGLAEQIVRQRTPVYREVYDAAKERLTRERGAEGVCEIEPRLGSADADEAQAEAPHAVDLKLGLRPIQIEERARKIAVKAFVGDLLVEWKRIAAP